MIRLLIADDHILMRDSLKQLFAVYGGILTVAEAANGAEVMERLRCTDVDLLVLDMDMSGLCGDRLIGRIHASYPELPILVFSLCNHLPVVRRALHAGARGFLVKGGDPDTLVDVVRRVAVGERFVDPSIAEAAVHLK